jgi:hypothetical protein
MREEEDSLLPLFAATQGVTDDVLVGGPTGAWVHRAHPPRARGAATIWGQAPSWPCPAPGLTHHTPPQLNLGRMFEAVKRLAPTRWVRPTSGCRFAPRCMLPTPDLPAPGPSLALPPPPGPPALLPPPAPTPPRPTSPRSPTSLPTRWQRPWTTPWTSSASRARRRCEGAAVRRR